MDFSARILPSWSYSVYLHRYHRSRCISPEFCSPVGAGRGTYLTRSCLRPRSATPSAWRATLWCCNTIRMVLINNIVSYHGTWCTYNISSNNIAPSYVSLLLYYEISRLLYCISILLYHNRKHWLWNNNDDITIRLKLFDQSETNFRYSMYRSFRYLT